jgi:hypothetical protein
VQGIERGSTEGQTFAQPDSKTVERQQGQARSGEKDGIPGARRHALAKQQRGEDRGEHDVGAGDEPGH